ncbi:MAG: RNA-binding S4 domain-containing protein [Pseudomonadota bacterium]
MTAERIDEQRIDRWLWCARLFKTRSAASKFVSTHRIKATRTQQVIRITKPSQCVRPDDILVFSRNKRLHILKIVACADRRGPACEAQMLYEDKSSSVTENGIPGDRAGRIRNTHHNDRGNVHAG